MTTIRTATALLAAAALAAAPAALARGGADDGGPGGGSGARGDVRVSASCTGSSTGKLKLSPDDGRIEVELEVDQNQNGVPWRVVLRDNGAIVASATRTTRAPSGSFSLGRRIADRPGTDRVTARATSPSGEVCTARASI